MVSLLWLHTANKHKLLCLMVKCSFSAPLIPEARETPEKIEFNHRKCICFTALVTVTEYIQPFYLEIRNTGQSIFLIVAFPADKNN